MKEFLTDSTKEFISMLPHLVWICSPEGPCEFLSRQWVEYTGRSEEEQLGYGWLDAIHPDDRERVGLAWREHAAALLPMIINFRIRRYDGEYRWFKTRALPVLNSSGACRYWVGTNSDVQLLIETQDFLMESKGELEVEVSESSRHLAAALEDARSLTEQLEEAQAVSRTGSWTIDLRTGEVVWSRQLFDSMGLNSADGAPRFEDQQRLMSEDSWSRLNDALNRTLATGEPYELELEFHCPNGKRCIGLGRGRVRRAEDGEITHVVGTFQDITELRMARDRLTETQNLLRQFVKHAPAAIAMLDNDVCYLEVSDRWISDYGLDGVDVIGRCHYDVFPDIPERWKEVHRRVLSGTIEKMEEDPFPREDGSTVWLQWECQPWYQGDGTIGGIIFFTQVITERKEMEFSLLEHQEALARSNRDLENFAHAASHDLQTPLRAVCSCVELLEERLGASKDAGTSEILRHIVQGSERMSRLVKGILSYSKTEQELEMKRLDLELIVGSALSELRSAERCASVRMEIEALPMVTGSEPLLISLYKNLIGNAGKYGAKFIVVGVRDREEGRCFFVRDDGIGIEAEYLEQIFELFKRLHTYEQYPGSGIGLSLCRRIVECHGGRIWAESTPGQGATFWFTLKERDSK